PSASQVFRVRYSRAGIGSIVGVALGAVASILAGSPLPLGAGWIAGFLIGRRFRVHRCSDCLYVVAPEASHCPHCKGKLGKEILRRDDRLEALETSETSETSESENREL